ncbi:MAG: hypothetical protein LBQ54_08545 [Planctomycetaceae bacterium]|jgi:biotin synthase|nr:hypothetical protein [Planctomycetaceae bacterium]
MKIDKRIYGVLDRSMEGIAPSKEECIELLRIPERTLEASLLRSVADELMRKRFHNQAMLMGQIGIETFPCPGDCQFCVFGETHTAFPKTEINDAGILEAAVDFTAQNDLYALFLMVMHTFDENRLLQIVESVRSTIPASTALLLNMGDFSPETAKTFAAAGVSGMYHVLRLREGTDSKLDPEHRRQTIRAIKEAGLLWFYCCEPIGPEHTPEELTEQIFLGLEYKCFQHATMRRIRFPGSPLFDRGIISELRLAQITAVVALAMIDNPELRAIAVHEPNLPGLLSGANSICAESGANPRDTSENTNQGRGRDTTACKLMFAEAGFTSLYNAGGDRFSLEVG